MANIKYWDEWKDFEDNTNRLEILTEDIVTPERVTIKSFQLKNKVELFDEKSTVGVGAEFSIISPTKLQYLSDLYTINIKELKVIHYLNGVINFVGYMDTEQYSDDFSDRVNYEIELTANNGIAILDRIKLSDDNGNVLTGIKSAFDILRYILRKLGIGYEYVNIALSTSIPGLTLLSSENILQKIHVNTDNYIDEKGNVMSCREVLDSILLPLTAQLFIEENQVYIVDINNMAKDSITYKRYGNTHSNYVMFLPYDSTFTINNLFDIDEITGSHNVGYQSGVSKIDVKFNKYLYDKITELQIADEVISNKVITEIVDNWRLEYFTNCDRYQKFNASTLFVKQTKTDDYKDVEFYVKALKDSKIVIDTGIQLVSSKTRLKLTGEFMVEFMEKFNQPQNLTIVNSGVGNWYFDAPYFYSIQVPWFRIKIKIGNYIYTKNGWELITSETDKYQQVYWMRDLFTPLKINQYLNLENALITSYGESAGSNDTNIIHLNNDNGVGDKTKSIHGGNLIIEIETPKGIGFWGDKNDVYSFRFKDLGVSIEEEDENGNFRAIGNNDAEYQGTLNDDFIDDRSLDLIHGTDNLISRGGLLIKRSGLYSDSDFATNERLVNISDLNREGVTGTIEELLLNTYLSNLQIPRYKFSCSLQGYFSQLQLYKYDLLQRNSQSVKMVATSHTTDYVNSITSLDLLEVVKDELSKA